MTAAPSLAATLQCNTRTTAAAATLTAALGLRRYLEGKQLDDVTRNECETLASAARDFEVQRDEGRRRVAAEPADRDPALMSLHERRVSIVSVAKQTETADAEQRRRLHVTSANLAQPRVRSARPRSSPTRSTVGAMRSTRRRTPHARPRWKRPQSSLQSQHSRRSLSSSAPKKSSPTFLRISP